jgi:ATP synthase I subunit
VSEIVNSVIGGEPARPDGLEARIFRSMLLAVAIATAISAFVGPWRVTTGLLFGGLLSLVNYRWLHGSVAALLNVQQPGTRPRPRIWKHAFRYLVIAGAVFAAYKVHIVSLPATIVGLCSFVVALFVEAFRQFYFAIIRREESF